jgi:K+-dependent Na+/Ca+ exchanger-like protein
MKECECNYYTGDNAPLNAFDFEQYKEGLFILPILGVIYMFLALMIVCDEFFVPALDVIVDRLGISNDVAGATFMAAGGSAPELFTSFIGTFGGSAIGFAAIVGSAVFNVLFVIGCCALFAKGVLKLTWWPLARDCSYYCLSLLMLALFFSVIAGAPLPTCPTATQLADGNLTAIYWWEALILLGMYVGYVLIMKFNIKLHSKILKLKCMQKKDAHHHKQSSFRRNVVVPADSEAPSPETEETTGMVETTEVQTSDTASSGANVTSKAGFMNFRAGMFGMMKGDGGVNSAAVGVVTRIKGDVRATFDSIDESGDGYIDKSEIKTMLETLGINEVTPDAIDQILKEIEQVATKWDGTKPDQVAFEEFTDWYLQSDQRMKVDVEKKFRAADADNSGHITSSELETFMNSIGTAKVTATPEDVEQAMKQLDPNGDGQITLEEFEAWYTTSSYYEHHRAVIDEGEEDAQPLDMSCPKSCRKALVYFLLLPLTGSLWLTLPDVRNPKKEKWFAFSFVGSIVWIGVYSYLMVWWAQDIGCVAGIPVRRPTTLHWPPSPKHTITAYIVSLAWAGRVPSRGRRCRMPLWG